MSDKYIKVVKEGNKYFLHVIRYKGNEGIATIASSTDLNEINSVAMKYGAIFNLEVVTYEERESKKKVTKSSSTLNSAVMYLLGAKMGNDGFKLDHEMITKLDSIRKDVIKSRADRMEVDTLELDFDLAVVIAMDVYLAYVTSL